MSIKNAIGNWSAATVSAVARKIMELLQDRSGQVAMIFGIATIPLFASVGVAVDMAQQSRVHLKVAGTADAIALAAARSYKDLDNRNSIANKYLNANLSDQYGPGVKVTSLSVNFDDAERLVTVNLVADVPTIMMHLFGIKKTTANIKSVVSYEGQVSEPVSLGLVLDVSGSMNDNGKIGTLRKAGKRLLYRLYKADPERDYVRSGLATYNNKLKTTVSMRWGVGKTYWTVDDLSAGGGTASTPAVDRVGGWLMGDTEQQAHEAKNVHNGNEFNLKRFLIFMTDGENNHAPDDTATQNLCDQIKADGVEIYTVAFEAPERGEQLLRYCASDDDHYFDADNQDEFLSAFDEIGDRIETSLLRIID